MRISDWSSDVCSSDLSPSAQNLENTYLRSRTEGFGEEVKRRIMLGTFVLSAGYYDAYYSKAQKVRRLIRDALFKLLETYDFVLLPTAPTPARSEEHTSELQSLMRISYAVFCLKKKTAYRITRH